jgi:hypothetical protein
LINGRARTAIHWPLRDLLEGFERMFGARDFDLLARV